MDISFSYEVSWDDYIDSQLTYDRNSNSVKANIKKTRIGLISFYIFLILILYHAVNGIGRIAVVLGLLLIGAVHISLVRKLLEIRVKRVSKKLIRETKSDKIIGKKKLKIKDEELLYVEKEKNTKVKVKDVKRILESGKNYYIYLDEVSAIILPKNLEGETDAQKEMIEYIKERMGGSPDERAV